MWRVLLHLAADPYPDVSDLAMKVLNSIAYKVRRAASSATPSAAPVSHECLGGDSGRIWVPPPLSGPDVYKSA